MGMKAGISRLEQGALFFIGQKPNFVVVLRLPLDPGRRVPRDLLVVDANTEDEREGRLPAVPARRLPIARLCLFGQPTDNFLFGNLLGGPVTEDGEEFARVFRRIDTDSGDERGTLYDLEKQLLDALNVELEYQVRRNLKDWLVAAPSAVPAPVNAQPLPPPS